MIRGLLSSIACHRGSLLRGAEGLSLHTALMAPKRKKAGKAGASKAEPEALESEAPLVRPFNCIDQVARPRPAFAEHLLPASCSITHQSRSAGLQPDTTQARLCGSGSPLLLSWRRGSTQRSRRCCSEATPGSAAGRMRTRIWAPAGHLACLPGNAGGGRQGMSALQAPQVRPTGCRQGQRSAGCAAFVLLPCLMTASTSVDPGCDDTR